MLALILARGGSKGLPGKNIRALNGLPLLAYSIKAAKETGRIEGIVLSTEDPEIAKLGKAHGAEVPFMRPAELAQDSSPVREAIIYTIDRLTRENGRPVKEFVLLQPTSPLRTAQDVSKAMDLFQKKQADAVISVCKAHHPPFWAKAIAADGKLEDYFITADATLSDNRQEHKPCYYPNGAIYIFNYQYFKNNENYYAGNVFAYEMPKERSVDIDDLFDFTLAEFLINIKNDDHE